MVGFFAVGAFGVAGAIAYLAGYGTRAFSRSTTKTSLIAAGNIPDFSHPDTQGVFTKAVTELLSHLDTREDLYPWQRLWTPDSEEPYLQLAAQVDLLRSWLMGVSKDVRTEAAYKKAKRTAIDLICPKSGLEANKRLIDNMNEGILPIRPFNSSLCDRIRRFQPQIADKIESSLCMQGPNRYAYDILPSTEHGLASLFQGIQTALLRKKDAHATYKWIWWLYKPSDTTNCASAVEKTAQIAACMWAQLAFPPKGAEGHDRTDEFCEHALRAAEIGRQILAKVEDKDFKTFYAETYEQVQFTLGPIKKGLSDLNAPITREAQFNKAEAEAALEKNQKLLTLIEQVL